MKISHLCMFQHLENTYKNGNVDIFVGWLLPKTYKNGTIFFYVGIIIKVKIRIILRLSSIVGFCHELSSIVWRFPPRVTIPVTILGKRYHFRNQAAFSGLGSRI